MIDYVTLIFLGDTTDDLEVTLQDMLILELLNWFKNDFFTWVDSPPCENCKSATKFSHMSDDVNLLKYTDRVEVIIGSIYLF